LLLIVLAPLAAQSLADKAGLLQKNSRERHMLDGLYVSIVSRRRTRVNCCTRSMSPANVIQCRRVDRKISGGVGYQVRGHGDPAVRRHGGRDPSGAARFAGSDRQARPAGARLCEGTVRSQASNAAATPASGIKGKAKYADYRFYSDVSVDNSTPCCTDTPSTKDLAADAAQKAIIAEDVDRYDAPARQSYRIIDLDRRGDPVGHVGIDPAPSRDPYYLRYLRTYGCPLQRDVRLASLAAVLSHGGCPTC